MKVLYYYDQLFKTRFGANSEAVLDSVNNFVQGFFMLPSLTTTITLDKQPHRELQTSFTNKASGATL
jgi:hypothetical protein